MFQAKLLIGDLWNSVWCYWLRFKLYMKGAVSQRLSKLKQCGTAIKLSWTWKLPLKTLTESMTQQIQKKAPMDKLEEDWNGLLLWFFLLFSWMALTLICIPFDIPVQEMNYKWPYESFMCNILYALQTMSLFASVFTLTSVSLTRYWAILYPLRRQLSTTNAKWLIIIIRHDHPLQLSFVGVVRG